MPIWKREFTLETLNNTSSNTLMAHLDICYTQFDESSLTASMPVNSNTHQPLGMLHGGASVALAESVGSLAANMCVDKESFCVGLEINANHIRAVRSGFVYAVASPLHLGATTQVWDIRINDDKQRLVCISRLTVAVKKRVKK